MTYAGGIPEPLRAESPIRKKATGSRMDRNIEFPLLVRNLLFQELGIPLDDKWEQ